MAKCWLRSSRPRNSCEPCLSASFRVLATEMKLAWLTWASTQWLTCRQGCLDALQTARGVSKRDASSHCLPWSHVTPCLHCLLQASTKQHLQAHLGEKLGAMLWDYSHGQDKRHGYAAARACMACGCFAWRSCLLLCATATSLMACKPIVPPVEMQEGPTSRCTQVCGGRGEGAAAVPPSGSSPLAAFVLPCWQDCRVGSTPERKRHYIEP